jgi:hypothetical protein
MWNMAPVLREWRHEIDGVGSDPRRLALGCRNPV